MVAIATTKVSAAVGVPVNPRREADQERDRRTRVARGSIGSRFVFVLPALGHPEQAAEYAERQRCEDQGRLSSESAATGGARTRAPRTSAVASGIAR
jgi:hypothetical protein